MSTAPPLNRVGVVSKMNLSHSEQLDTTRTSESQDASDDLDELMPDPAWLNGGTA